MPLYKGLVMENQDYKELAELRKQLILEIIVYVKRNDTANLEIMLREKGHWDDNADW